MISMYQLADVADRTFAMAVRAQNVEIGPGWFELLLPVLDKLESINKSREPGKRIRFSQVKEKFGLLRIRFCGEDIPQDLLDLATKAESRSQYYCEYCGSNNSVTTEGVRCIKTLCSRCRRDNVRIRMASPNE